MKKHLKLLLVLLAVVVLGGVLVVAQRPGLFKGQLIFAPAAPSGPLVITNNTSMGNQIVVAGSVGARLGSWVLQSSADININNFIVRTSAQGRQYFTNIRLQTGIIQLGRTISTFSNKKYYFAVQHNISSGQSVVIDLYADVASSYTPIPEDVVFDLTAEYMDTVTGQSDASNTVAGQTIMIFQAGTLSLSRSVLSPIGSPSTEFVLGEWGLRTDLAEPVAIRSFCFDLNSGGNNTAQASDFNGVFILRERDGAIAPSAGGRILFSRVLSSTGNDYFDDACLPGQEQFRASNYWVIPANSSTYISLNFAGTHTASGKTIQAELGQVQAVGMNSGASLTAGIHEVSANQLTF